MPKIRDYMKKASYLQDMLRELPDELLDTIIIRTYSAGEYIMKCCEENRDTYIVLSGVCCATCNFISGERDWFRKKTVSDVFGLLGIMESEYSFSASIFAKTKCVLAQIPGATMARCFGYYPRFTLEISQKVVNRLNHELWKIEECNAYPPYIALVTYLIYSYQFYVRCYPEGYSGPVKIIEKQSEIAHYIGVNVRTLQRVLPTVHSEGLIDLRAGKIYISLEHYERLRKRKIEYFK